MTGPSTCRSCRAPIFWALTQGGKRIPIDADAVPDGNLALDDQNPPVATVVRPGAMLFDDNGSRFVSHFATCPQADQHRRRSS